MDDNQAAVARIALAAAARFGFVIAGGNAISLHGIGNRPSDDVDLFTNNADVDQFSAAVHAVTQALDAAGWKTDTTPHWGTYVRIVASKDGATVSLDLSQDYRSEPPTVMTIGPVLSMRDAVGNKMITLYSRGEVRDYLDVAEIVRSGHFSRDELIAMADQVEAAPMDRKYLIDRFRSVSSIPAAKFVKYRATARTIQQTREIFQHWADLLSLEQLPPSPDSSPIHRPSPEIGF